MLIQEYRVILPLTVEEYQVAQLFTIADMSKCETGGGEGIEVLKNEPFDGKPFLSGKFSSGQYTLKIYHVESKMPRLIKFIFPRGSLKIYEECWNAYPYSKTVLTNPGYMKDDFQLIIESLHIGDRGDQHNVLELAPETLEKREVTIIDIANDPINSKPYEPCWDPSLYHSEKTDRGPLEGDWQATVNPVMTCYKLVTVNFKWFGLQRRIEKFTQSFEKRLITVFHRRLFCSTDQWFGLTMDDIRQLEDETKEFLDKERVSGEVRGTVSSMSD